MTLQECNHHELVEFDADKARAMTAQEVRKAYKNGPGDLAASGARAHQPFPARPS